MIQHSADDGDFPYSDWTAPYRLINQVTGAEELVPIDRSTMDAERAIYGVRPLPELPQTVSGGGAQPQNE